MHMIRAYFCLYDFDFFPLAKCSQDFSHFPSLFFVKDFSSVLRCKYDVIFAIPFLYVINCLCRSLERPPFAVLCSCQTASLFCNKRSSFFYIIGISFLLNHAPSAWFSVYNQSRLPKREPAKFFNAINKFSIKF